MACVVTKPCSQPTRKNAFSISYNIKLAAKRCDKNCCITFYVPKKGFKCSFYWPWCEADADGTIKRIIKLPPTVPNRMGNLIHVDKYCCSIPSGWKQKKNMSIRFPYRSIYSNNKLHGGCGKFCFSLSSQMKSLLVTSCSKDLCSNSIALNWWSDEMEKENIISAQCISRIIYTLDADDSCWEIWFLRRIERKKAVNEIELRKLRCHDVANSVNCHRNPLGAPPASIESPSSSTDSRATVFTHQTFVIKNS